MLKVLKNSYPFSDDLKHNARVIFFISLGVFVFFLVFQPFEINSLPDRQKYYLMAGFSIITFIVLSINLLVIPSLLPGKFASAKWNIRKEIIWNSWILFTILVCFFFFTRWMGFMQFNFATLIKLTLTATLPISGLIIINHNRMLRSNLRIADELNRMLRDHKSMQEKIVHFTSDYQKDSLAVKAGSILLIRSANNYIEVFWKDGNNISKQMVRCSITHAEEMVKEYRFIFKCHRSYMVNVSYIERFEGNSQGYKLYVENIGFEIPVSRSSSSRLRELI